MFYFLSVKTAKIYDFKLQRDNFKIFTLNMQISQPKKGLTNVYFEILRKIQLKGIRLFFRI